MNTRISIVTPCFNAAPFLKATLESAVNQTLPPLEIIIVDDGSTDNSAEVAESFGPPVRVYRQENRGESAARNRAIDEVKGDYVLFLDADDLLHPETLQRLAAAVDSDPNRVAVMGFSVFLDGSEEEVSRVVPQVEGFFPTIAYSNPGALHCYLTSMSLVRKAGGFYEDLCFFEDWDFWCQVALAGGQLFPIDFVGAYYRRHANAQTPKARDTDRKLGHVIVMERLLSGMLKQPALVEQHGDTVFWAGWAAMRSAIDLGIPWAEFSSLADVMQHLADRGPISLRRSRFGRLVRLLGIRWACRMQQFVYPQQQSASVPPLLERVRALEDGTSLPAVVDRKTA